jgi:3-isopropylmalate dehydrogenase
MFDYAFNLKEEAETIRNAVEKSIEIDFVTEDLTKNNPRKTSEVGNWIRDFILK